MSLRIRILRTLDECRSIRDDWARLVQMEGRGVLGFDVSATFEWTEALWLGFLDGAPHSVLVAEDDSGVRGILPCFVLPEKIGGISHLKLVPTTGIYDLRTGFLVGGDAEVLACLLAYVMDQLHGWDTFIFRTVDTGPSDLAISEVLRRRNVKVAVMQHWRSPYISLPAEPAQVLAGLGSKLRYNIRRGEKQLRNLGKLESRFFDSHGSVSEFLDLISVVEKRSWKLNAGTAMTTSAMQQKLYGVVTPAIASRGWFLGAALLLDDRPLAFVYGYAFEGVFVDEKESYDEQFKVYGPGNVLKIRFLEELVRRGLGTHDYAGAEDPHKARWTEQTYSRHLYILYKNTLRGQLVRGSVAVRKRWASLRQPK